MDYSKDEISYLEEKISRINPLRITPEFGYAHHFSKKMARERGMVIHGNKLYQVDFKTDGGVFSFECNAMVIYGNNDDVKYTKVVFNQMYGYRFNYDENAQWRKSTSSQKRSWRLRYSNNEHVDFAILGNQNNDRCETIVKEGLTFWLYKGPSTKPRIMSGLENYLSKDEFRTFHRKYFNRKVDLSLYLSYLELTKGNPKYPKLNHRYKAIHDSIVNDMRRKADEKRKNELKLKEKRISMIKKLIRNNMVIIADNENELRLIGEIMKNCIGHANKNLLCIYMVVLNNVKIAVEYENGKIKEARYVANKPVNEKRYPLIIDMITKNEKVHISELMKGSQDGKGNSGT